MLDLENNKKQQDEFYSSMVTVKWFSIIEK